MKLLFEHKIPAPVSAFKSKVVSISRKLDVDPNWLMAVMNFESGINPAAQNSRTNATGLIQFMPNTAAGLGTSVQALKAMSAVKQLDYVDKYLSSYKGKLVSAIDLYFAVFFPAAMTKPDSYVLKSAKLSAGRIASANPGFDLNKNGEITVGEVKAVYLGKIPSEYKSLFNKKMDTVEKFARRNWVKAAIFTVTAMGIALYITKTKF